MYSYPSSKVGRGASAIIAAAIAGVLASPAFAQEQKSDGGLEEIVVTARKVEERLVDVPIAITAFTADEMARRNIFGIADVAKYTAGFSFENYSGGATNAPTIRGLSQTVLADRNQNVATFVDGVHVQLQGAVDFSLLEMERIEVLKGPQNSQYGRSAFAGAINYVPKAPVLGEWSGDVAVTAGTDERKEVRAGVSIPLWSDKLAVRLYGVASEFDGTWENKFAGGDKGVSTTDTVAKIHWKGTDGNVGGYDNEAYRVSLTFQPIESLTIDASYYDSEIRAEYGPTAQVRPGARTVWGLDYQTNCSPNALGTLQLYCGELKVNENNIRVDPRSAGNYADSELSTARIAWQPFESLTATYVYGRGEFSSAQFNQSTIPPNPEREACGPFNTLPCAPGQAGVSLFAIGRIEEDATSHEIRFDGKFGDQFDWRVGYYTSKVDDDSLQNSVEYRRSLIADPSGQIVTLSVPVPLSKYRDENDSAFASVSWRFLDIWTLDVEGRYSWEDRLLVGSPIGTREFTEFTPRVNLKVQPSREQTYYVSVAKGSKAGGFNTVTAPPGDETYDPETNLTYEIGAKQLFLDGRLQVNAAVFYVDWTDLQVTTANLLPPLAGTTARSNYVANASGAESMGVELEAIAAIGDHWRANFAGSYSDPKYDDGTRDAGLGALCNSTQPVCTAILVPRPPAAPAVVADIGGNTIARTPKSKVAAGLEYYTNFGDWKFFVRGDVSYQSKIYAEALNVAYLPDRTLVDANIGVSSPDDRWSVNLWGRNLTDEVYAANSFVIGFANYYNPTLGDGRTAGITARLKF